ncbi:MAG: exo-alpha-sialidase [Deltaproteobacteria bacterium]|nr:exo-alpha-sialidase [Deltaproteobacteria bacterium]
MEKYLFIINKVAIYSCVGVLLLGIFGCVGSRHLEPNFKPASLVVKGPYFVAPSKSPFAGSCGLESEPGFFYPPDAETDALIVVNPNAPNNIVCAFMQDHCVAVSIATSDDYGMTWRAVLPPELSSCTGGVDECYGDQSIAVEPDGTMHLLSVVGSMSPPEGNPVTWSATGEVTFDVMVIAHRSTDGGKTWAGPVVVSPKGEYQHNTQVAVDPNIRGRIYCAWCTTTRNIHRSPGHLEDGYAYVSRSDDSGLSWGTPVKVTKIEYEADIEYVTDLKVLKSGAVVLSTEHETIISKNGGDSWSEARPLGVQSSSRWSAHPEARSGFALSAGERPLAVGPNGDLYQVGPDVNGETGTGEVWIARSIDEGASWETPRVVAKSDGLVFSTHCAVAPDGTIGVMWYDTRENVLGDKEITTHVFFAVSKNDGESWTEIQLSEPFDMNQAALIFGKLLYLGNYQSLVPTGGHDFAAAFAVAPPVALAGAADIQFARINVPEMN